MNNQPYELCYACGEGQKSREQCMAEMATHDTTFRIPMRQRMIGESFTLPPDPNARCPCGSKKKYKKCCSSTTFVASPRKSTRVKRNAPCPCGSGKKYKKCCIHQTSN